MSSRLAPLGTVLLLALALGCFETRDADRRTLARARARYGAVADLSISDAMYLEVRAKTPAGVPQPTLEALYVMFVGDSAQASERSWIVYVNYYDTRNQFVYQIYRDKGRFVRSSVEYQ